MTEVTRERMGPLAGYEKFRARRIEVRREAGRRRLRRLLLLMAASAVVVCAVGLAQSAAFDVDHINVAGASQTDSTSIVAAAGIDRGDTMATLDLGAAKRRLLSLPWVLEADVSRSFPGDVSIKIRERVATALVASPDEVVLVDRDRRVLGPAVGTAGADLVIIEIGEDLPQPGQILPEDLTAAVELATLADRASLTGIVVGIRVTPELTVGLLEGGNAVFGDASELADKVDALATVIKRVDLSCLDVLDLRVPTHPVLTRDSTCT